MEIFKRFVKERDETGQKAYCCKVCNSRFSKKNMVKRYIQNIHKESESEDEDDALIQMVKRKHLVGDQIEKLMTQQILSVTLTLV